MLKYNSMNRAKPSWAASMYPREGLTHFFFACLFGILFLCQSSPAVNFVTRTTQGSGQNWNAAIWSNTVAGGALVAPTAGNSYEVLSNALIRPPTSASSPGSPQVFPGDSLQFDAGGSVRLKSSAPPAPGYFTFNNQGGQL